MPRMIRKQTLFVVGAGASNEVGLPVGSELAARIARKMDITFSDGWRMDGSGDHQIYEVLKRRGGGTVNDYLPACWKIRDNIRTAQSEISRGKRREARNSGLGGGRGSSNIEISADRIRTFTEQVDDPKL